ncbi:MAG TPA: hypothetical protein P5026_10230 [Kiritimatiellia bacterium]|nr:hypothetical protein [Kiritimatiellia bacterium]HRU70172.1 hypothetical protein [Kiritimatiellia bacterium]
MAVDLRTLTATASFGPPAALGPADLAGFLSAFRNLRRSTAHMRRSSGEAGGEDESDNTLEYMPSTSSGFTKTGCARLEMGGGTGAKVSIDPAALKTGKPAEFRDIEFTGADGELSHARVLCSEPEPGPADGEEPGDPCADHPGGGAGGEIGGGAGGGIGGGAGGSGGSGPPGDGRPVCPPSATTT